jgi:limonene-1,2-epoxide hydrolase
MSARESLCHPSPVSYRSLALLAGVAVGLAGTVCGGAQSASRGPAQVVKAFFDAVNAGQIDKAMNYVSPKAVFDEPIGTFTGRAAVRGLVQREVKNQVLFHHSNFRVHGGRVVYTFRVTQYPEGIIATGNDGLTIVKDGKIVWDGTVHEEAMNAHRHA